MLASQLTLKIPAVSQRRTNDIFNHMTVEAHNRSADSHQIHTAYDIHIFKLLILRSHRLGVRLELVHRIDSIPTARR